MKRWSSSTSSASAGATLPSAPLTSSWELAERLSLVGQATETEFECPLSQLVIAEPLGLTAIHVNRVLRQLRNRGLLTVRKKTVKIGDLAGLRSL